MIKVGLTGGIASGKSLVSRMFTELGAHTIDADELAHELMTPGQPAYNEIVEKFGDSILHPDKTINRSKLAELAFDKKRPRIYELNRILHPGVIQKYEGWMDDIEKQEPEAVVMLEAALLLEAGLRRRFDKIVVVTLKQQQRIERWSQRFKVDQETARLEVTRRMMAQAPDEAKLQAADFVIDNSGSVDETKAQVKNVYDALLSQAKAKTA
ncbi:MAG TPA: dephospho-CoA kinase [Terriglobales bacterium]|jgi:dephospho-CoA kinase|nr:dephospho-CoA kinase [Terriglobales bacterium]